VKTRPAARPEKRRAATESRVSTTTLKAQLEEQLRFEKLISDLSARFVRVSNDRLDEEITRAIEELRVFFGCDRCGLLRAGGREGVFLLTHISYGEGIEHVPDDIDLAAIFPWSYEMYFRRGEPIVFAKTDEVPPEAAVDKATAIAMGIKSSMGVPLFSGDVAKHAIVFQALREERSWPDLIVQRVRTLGEIFVNALERRRAEDALRESELRLNLAAEAAEAGLWILDPQTGVFWITPKIRELFHLSADEPASVERIIGAIHPQDRDKAMGAMERAWDIKASSGVEYRVVQPDGEIRWFASRGQVLTGGPSKVRQLMGITFDITAKKNLEEAARLHEAEFRTMFDLSAVGIAQVDPSTGRFLRANAKYCEITGYSPEELQGLTYRDITHPEDQPHNEEEYTRVLAGDAMYWSTEKRYVRKDGTVRWVSVSGTVIHGEEGRPMRSLAAIADITARRRAEEALRESERKYRALYESLRDAYVRVDMEGRLLEWNGAYAEMLGYSDEELGRLTYQDLTPERWRETEAGIVAGQVFVRGYSDVYEKEYRRRNGKTFPVEIRTFLLRDGAGLPTGMWAIVRDVSERRQVENEAQTLRDELAHVTRVATLGELTATLAHELNQPLSAIQSNAQTAQRLLARGGVASGELTDILSDIVADNRRASDMIRHLRAALKKGKMEVQTLNLGDLVREVAALVLPDILRRDTALFLDLDPDAPQVRGDKIQLQQVLMNLMVNSLQAMQGSGGGHLAVRCFAGDMGAVQVSVEDSGPGIPEDRLEGIFEPFFTSKAQGLGMGLTICRSIAHAHGGKLWAENRPEGGAVFHMTLPATPAGD
jgi:two-component system sensor kinase FixL